MSISYAMLELAEELVDPAEAVLDDQVEEAIDNEEDALCGVGDTEDDIIEFIANGNRVTNADPVDFTDDDVDDMIFDDAEDDTDDGCYEPEEDDDESFDDFMDKKY